MKVRGLSPTPHLPSVLQARAGAVADTIAQFVTSFAACEDCTAASAKANANALLKEGGGRAAPEATRGGARRHAVLWVWEQHNALSAMLAARTAPAAGASALHEACLLNVTANAGVRVSSAAGDVQLSQVRLYGARGVPLEVSVARAPEWCHSTDPEGADMVLDSSLSTKWLCRAARAELHLTLASPAAVTGYEMWTANDFANRDPHEWELRCGAVGGGAAAGGAAVGGGAGAAAWLLHRGTAVKRAFGEAAPRKKSMGRVDIVPQRRGFKPRALKPTLVRVLFRPARHPAPRQPAPRHPVPRHPVPRRETARKPPGGSEAGIAPCASIQWRCGLLTLRACHAPTQCKPDHTNQASPPARVCQGGVAESRGVRGMPRASAPARAAGRRCRRYRRQRRNLRRLVPAPSAALASAEGGGLPTALVLPRGALRVLGGDGLCCSQPPVA